MEPVTLSLGAALLLGLGFGAGPCNIACLPYLGPVFLASGDGVRDGWRTILPFSLGRLTGYALLGALAGVLGQFVQGWIEAPWVRWLLGGATILVALSLLWGRKGCETGHSEKGTEVRFDLGGGRHSRPYKGPSTIGLFLMGTGMALNPCAPLSTVMLAAAATLSGPVGLSLGLSFGFGAVAIPSLIFALGVAHFGAEVRAHLHDWQGALEKTGVALLLLFGTGTAMGWIAP